MPPSRSRSIDSMYITTWRLARNSIVDQIMTATPFFYWLDKKGCRDPQSGGAFIEQELQYAKNESVQCIAKGQSVEVVVTDPLTSAWYDWKYLTGHIVRFNADWQKNKGKAQRMRKVEKDIANLRDSLVQKTEEYLFGDGTADDGAAFNGLDLLVPEDPTTGTVGQLNRATYPWWRSQSYDMTDETISLYLIDRLRNMFNTCGQQTSGAGSQFPDFHICHQDIHEAYEAEVGEISRIIINDEGIRDLGHGELAYKGGPCVWAPQCPQYTWFMLNTDFIQWTVDTDQEFDQMDFEPIYNQPGDAISHNLTACNLTMSNLSRHGRIYGIGETS